MNFSNKRAPRLLELDAMRGIAVVSVMLFHYTTRFDLVFGHSEEVFLSVPDGGRYGVTLFFAISGFVILMTLDRTRSVVDFAVARFCRLYPAYWAAVLTTFTLVHLCGLPGGREHGFGTLLVNLTMVQRLFGVRSIDGVYWTLLVELLFYFLMACIVLAGLRGSLHRVVSLVVLAGLVTWLLGYDLPSHNFTLHLHKFLIGIVLFEMRRGWRWEYLVPIVLCFFASAGYGGSARLTVFTISAIFMYLATQFGIPFLRSPVLIFLGTISYPLYLLHQYLGYIVIRYCYSLGVGGNLSIVTAMLFCMTLAGILCFGIERPANRFLRGKYRQWKTSRASEEPTAPSDGLLPEPLSSHSNNEPECRPEK